MSDEEGSGSTAAGGYVPPIALTTLKSNNDDEKSENENSSPAVAAVADLETTNNNDDDTTPEVDVAKDDESSSVNEESSKPAAAPTAGEGEGGATAGGLFAGLSLSPSASNSNGANNSSNDNYNAAKAPEAESAKQESTEQQPSSRAPTPVHSNAAAPPSPGSSANNKVVSTDNNDTAATPAVNKSLVKRGSAGSAASSSSEKGPASTSPATKINQKQKPTVTTTTPKTTENDLMLQITILPPSKKQSSSFSSTTLTNTDTTLRLLRKFYTKSAPSIPQHAGGSQPVSWYGWMFGPSVETAGNEDPALKCYHDFTEALGVVNDDGEHSGGESAAAASDTTSSDKTRSGGEDDVIVESILGHKDDSPSKARETLASFIQLVHCWCLTSAQVAEALLEKGGDENGGKSHDGVVTEELLSLAISTASSLVAHGCLDDLYVNIGHPDKIDGGSAAESTEEPQEIDEILDSTVDSVGAPSLVKKAVNVLSESIFAADLSMDQIELAALKFLLTTGCRVAACSSDDAEENKTVMEPMLRGAHLLQTIRICSHVYLQTESKPNRTTAKAALQQLVISVFVRLERAIEQLKVEEKVESSTKSSTKSAEGTFASQDHRDAYLVLRSLCKLSMQTSTIHSPREGGGDSNEPSSGANAGNSAPANSSPDVSHFDKQALQSRILALELLLHILRHKSGGCILYAGPEFHYAIRQYLCTSLLKNTTSPDTTIVELSLRLFVPLIRNFRSLLKTEIEAFVTNVFFVILDSKNSTIQHKLLVITLFEEICSDATTLAEIFLNYDCDLSAVDLFQRIVNALGKVSRVGLTDATGSGATNSSLQFVAGAGATRAEKMRQDHRELRLAAMNALRQVLASLHSSIATPVKVDGNGGDISVDEASLQLKSLTINGNAGEKTAQADDGSKSPVSEDAAAKKTLVEMYGSKKKRREEESQAALKFNQKPMAGLKYASEKGHLDIDDPVDVAKYLLRNKDLFDKAQIGEFLGREKEWQDGFALKVLRAYGEELDFKGMVFDEAIRYYLSGFRLPGEAQKIDRIMEVFAARYTDQNSAVFPTADAAFILAFSIIMLNTDLHNPAIKEDRKMTIQSFQRMNSGVCDGGDFPDEMLEDIFNRIKTNPISLKEDDDARESAGIQKGGAAAPSALTTASDFFFGNHYVDEDNARKTNYQKEGDQIVRDTESMLRQRRKATKHPSSKKSLRDSLKKRVSVNFVGTADTGLKDEYVTPMFDVTWGPALAVFSTAIESANITESALSSIATDEEMDHAVDNAASVIEVSLNGFQLAICIAGICGNDTARDAYVRALYNFTLLGKGRLLSSRHIHCVQSLLKLGIDDGELLGVSWEHIFRALAEVNRLQQLWEVKARSDKKKRADDDTVDSDTSSEGDDVPLEDEMDKKGIDEANAKAIYGAISLNLVDSIFQRSSYLSRPSLKDFVYQLCRVSRMEISGYGGHVGSNANDIDLTNDHYMKHHTLVSDSTSKGVGGSQPAIYSLQKLVEVTQFNMESRPRLIFADIWGTISTHLTSTALHEEAAVAMFAVDSLRQLSMQFLNREELGVFEFQRRFLKPLETIMSRSTHVSVKEHLLSSVEQLILIYGFDEGEESSEKAGEVQKRTHQGTLRSGWRSVLHVLGTAGLDNNEAVASRGFQLLSAQIEQCVSICKKGYDDDDRPMSLLTEHFVDLVNALLLYVSGQSQDLSSKALESLMQISGLLAEGRVSVSPIHNKTSTMMSFHSDELELWWPILLGLSKTMGDSRYEVRGNGLQTLLSIINKYFFPSSQDKEVEKNGNSSPQHGDLQTLQLVFRGILVPALEFEEMDGNSTSGYAPELLPPKFVNFITAPPSSVPSTSDRGQREWIGTTFDHLIDGCVSICLKSMDAFGNDSLVEEVLAMLNSCLLSDSGHLAVKGLRRLQQFVTKDLDLKDITDDTWATVSHMLFRVLSIRGMPPPQASVPESEGNTDEQKEQLIQEYKDAMDEFIREQKLFSNRRYIGCNAAMVIGSLLTAENIVKCMGVQWYIFLMSGLGKGIKDWERAAEILSSSGSQESSSHPSPPHYLENVLYARRWMTKFILSLTSQTDAATLENAQFQQVLKEETESLLHAFLKKEADESCSAVDMRNVSKMVTDILEGFNELSEEKLSAMKWLSPVLSTCIQTNNTSLRTSVQILLTRLTQQK